MFPSYLLIIVLHKCHSYDIIVLVKLFTGLTNVLKGCITTLKCKHLNVYKYSCKIHLNVTLKCTDI